ncbi:MAG: hypothetical protein Q9214_003681, partial [Letrouitia sp. 1 TL-2023]
MPPLRRSTRSRVPNKRYNDNPFEDLDILSSASEIERVAQGILSDSDEDDEFALEKANQNEGIEEEEISFDEGLSDGSGIATPADEDNISSTDEPPNEADGDASRKTARDRVKAKLAARKLKQDKFESHIRGVQDPIHGSIHGARLEHVLSIFGPDTKDIGHFARCRDQWLGDTVLPSRTNPQGTRGFHSDFSHDGKNRTKASAEWHWYYGQGGRERLMGKQKSHSLSADEAIQFVPRPTNSTQTFLMGPYGNQKLCKLPYLSIFPLDDAWEHADHTDSDRTDSLKNKRKRRKRRRRRSREGWLLNVGTGVRCMDWVPKQKGETQFLTLSTLQPKNSQLQTPFKQAPAFTPSNGFCSSIQIWSFSVSTAPDQPPKLDANLRPQLSLVICSEWGDPRYLKWCPMPRDFPSEATRDDIPLGLLASIWTDGYARVLDISIPKSESTTTKYIQYTEPAFSIKPPHTICTSLCWLSTTNLAIGHANGFLALYSLVASPSLTLYLPLHETYINVLASAYPLAPHLLASSCMSGYFRLTDLRSPATSTVLAQRMRMPPSQIAFSSSTMCFIAVDEGEMVKAYPLRRFFAPVYVGRMPATPIAVDTGTFHSCVVMGCADGSTLVTNPLRKISHPKVPLGSIT